MRSKLIPTIFAIVAIVFLLSSVAMAADYWSYPFSSVNIPADGKAGGWKYWLNGWGWHLGQDILKPAKTQVKNARWGYVRHVDVHTKFGHVVVIESPRDYEQSTNPSKWKNPICHIYGHLRHDEYLDNTIAKKGKTIDRGTVIGRVGNKSENGGWDAEHLHFGMRNGRYSSTWVYFGYTQDSTVLSKWTKPSNIVNNY